MIECIAMQLKQMEMDFLRSCAQELLRIFQ